jgi:hypothetical protein
MLRMVSVLVDIAPPVGKNRTGYACKTPHRPPPFRTTVTGRSGTVTARSGRPQNRSRSIGMIGHDRPESPVTTRRNQRSRAAGIRNVRTVVAVEHALIVTHEVTTEATDNTSLQSMAEAARDALEQPTLNVAADAGYSNGAQAEALEAQGICTRRRCNACMRARRPS